MNARHRTFFCSTILWIDYLTFTWWLMKTGFFWSSPRVKMSPRAIDRSIEILQTKLVLYNYFYYISCHFVTLTTLEYLCFPSNAGSWRFSNREWNFSSRKLLLQAVCYCLHLVIRLWLKISTLLFYSELKSTVYALYQHVMYVSLPVVINRS